MRRNPFKQPTVMYCVALTAIICVILWTPWHHLRGINYNDERAALNTMQGMEPTQIVWNKFTIESINRTFHQNRVAVVWFGFTFSFQANTFEKFLGSAVQNVDYYELEVDWGKQRNFPFYNEFGVPKDGGVIVATPNGDTLCYTIGDGELENIRHILQELAIASSAVQEDPMNNVDSKDPA